MNSMNRSLLFLVLIVGVFKLRAQSFDNIKQEYTFKSLTEAMQEARRAQRLALADYQPTGLNIPGSHSYSIIVAPFDTVNYKVKFMVGFKPLWGDRNKQTEGDLAVGKNNIYSKNEGLLFISVIKKQGYDANPISVKVKIEGGFAIPFYYYGQTTASQFRKQVDSLRSADFVQLASDKVIVTIPYEDYVANPVKNLNNTFDTIHKVINWENECAGFEGTTKEHAPTRLRMHYIVDTYKKNGDGYYMYATGYQVGMLRSNFTELTNPKLLCKGWGVWHETGHTNQQPSWTWGAITEISVNIFSLYVQEKFGQPSPLNKVDGAASGVTLAQNIPMYLALPNKNFSVHEKTEKNPLFTKMMMFWQLKESYGWSLIQNVHRYFRENPKYDGNDQDKIDRFIYATCLLTKNDLRPFFSKWGLKIGNETNNKIHVMNLQLPTSDPTKNLTEKWKPILKDTKKLADGLMDIQNAERVKRGLKPLQSKPILMQQSFAHCSEMLKAAKIVWGESGKRQSIIKEYLGLDCKADFDLLVAEDVNSAADIWERWLADKKDGGKAFSKYDLAGISILQDNNSNDKFYIVEYFANDENIVEAKKLADTLFKAENEHRNRLHLKPFELKQELTEAAMGLCKEMQIKDGFTYGDYGGRAKAIQAKLGANVRVEFHLNIVGTGNVKEILEAWTCPDGGARQNIDGPYQYTGFGVMFDKGKYYLVQYVAYDSNIKN